MMSKLRDLSRSDLDGLRRAVPIQQPFMKQNLGLVANGVTARVATSLLASTSSRE
jgi:hypothetical protein